MVLRGSMDDVELEVLNKNPNWTICRQETKITGRDLVMSMLEFLDNVKK